MTEFAKTPNTTLTRLPKRGDYSKETIYRILDEALYCTLAYVRDGAPFQIPTGFCRIGNRVYIHGSVGSFYLREITENCLSVCISATLMDGIVLARSAFHHSMNYRSVVMFGKPEKVTDERELQRIFEAFTNKMQPGRWIDVRKPSQKEWKATMVLSFLIEEVSAKVRTGHPVDDEEDYELQIWAGIVPLAIQRQAPIADPKVKKDIPLPGYLETQRHE